MRSERLLASSALRLDALRTSLLRASAASERARWARRGPPPPCTPPCPSDNAKHHCACIQGLCPRNPVGAPSALSLVGSIASARIASAYAAYAISAPRSGTSSGLHGRSARSEGTPPRPPRGLRPRRGHPAPQPSLREPSAPSLTALRCEPAQAVSNSCESDTACATMDLVINATIATQ